MKKIVSLVLVLAMALVCASAAVRGGRHSGGSGQGWLHLHWR